jgi:SAM-dependent methyltransferase
MNTTSAHHRTDEELLDSNRRFYDVLWGHARLIDPQKFNTWPLVSTLISPAHSRLEVAPGLRPRLPLEGTHFVDLSRIAIARLRRGAASVTLATITALPFASAQFDLVCAIDIVEHVDDDDRAISELSRVCAAGGTLLIAVPLHPARWTSFDDFVGHCRRYEPALLMSKLSEHGFSIEGSAVYGMQPKSSRILDLGIWWLTHRREQAMWWYNRVFMPLTVRFQKKLSLRPGMIDAADVDEVLLVCRKQQARPVRPFR